MSRVLITGGIGATGEAFVRRLLADPAYEVRVSGRHPVAQWMREGCEVHIGDLRVSKEARAATAGCTHVIHLGTLVEATVTLPRQSHTVIEANGALCNALIHAALAEEVERFTYISSPLVFERASEFPTTEAHLLDCPGPESAYGFARLVGEVCCRAAHEEHGLRYTICRPCDTYGPDEAPHPGAGIAHTVPGLIARALSGQRPLESCIGAERTWTPTYVDDVVDGVLTAMSSPEGLNEDFNIAASRELTAAEIARIVWETCGEDREELELERPPTLGAGVRRRWPSVEKARGLLGWEARIEVEEGIAATVEWMRERGSIGSAA
jgi:UDP-glucose 4-epimerase